jgi:hypothetical protein
MLRYLFTVAVALAAMTPARAEVVASSDAGFVVRRAADVTADAEAVWAQLIQLRGWWDSQHSFSGDAANLSLDPRAGGCFCEMLPAKGSPRAGPRGSVEHMRVIYVEQPRALRLSGALGPLQAEAVKGTLTIALKPIEGGTRIMWEYVVGGYMRQKAEQMAPRVDAMLGEQLSHLADKLGAKPATGEPDTDATQEGATEHDGDAARDRAFEGR